MSPPLAARARLSRAHVGGRRLAASTLKASSPSSETSLPPPAAVARPLRLCVLAATVSESAASTSRPWGRCGGSMSLNPCPGRAGSRGRCICPQAPRRGAVSAPPHARRLGVNDWARLGSGQPRPGMQFARVLQLPPSVFSDRIIDRTTSTLETFGLHPQRGLLGGVNPVATSIA